MTRKVLSIASMLMAILTLSFFSSCKEEEPQQKPELKLTSSQLVDGVFSVTAQAGQYEIAYAIENAVEGAAVSAESAADWIEIAETVTGSPVDGKIVFSVAANEAAAREGKITVSYPDAAPQVVTVKQSAANGGDEPEEPSDEPFKVKIGNETMTSIEVAIYPKDMEMPYFMFYNTEEHFLENGLMDNDEALLADDLEFLKQDSEEYGEPLEDTFSFYLHNGEFGGPIPNLNPATRYVIYVYGVKLEDGKLVNTTDIYRFVAETKDYDKADVKFDFDFAIDGPYVNMTVTPADWEGHFFFDVLEGVTDPAVAQKEGVKIWMQSVDFYKMFGYDNKAILKDLAAQGTGSYLYELKGETQYFGYALAVTEECQPYSAVVGETFTTGKIVPSDNVITMEVSNIQARQADISIYTTNDDPYTAVIYHTDHLQGKTEEEIIASCLEIAPEIGKGEKHLTIPDLNPSTEYSVLAFGCVSGTATTGLFRVDFKTKEAVLGNATISVKWDRFYDIEAVAEIQPQFLDYLANGDCFLPLTVETDPADAEVFYFGAFSEEGLEASGIETTDAALTEFLLSYGPSQQRDMAYVVSYGENVFVIAIVEDENGNRSALWRSETFVLQKDGASDPQEFLDRYTAPARMPEIRVPYAPESIRPIYLFGVADASETVQAQANQPKYKALEMQMPRSRGAR